MSWQQYILTLEIRIFTEDSWFKSNIILNFEQISEVIIHYIRCSYVSRCRAHNNIIDLLLRESFVSWVNRPIIQSIKYLFFKLSFVKSLHYTKTTPPLNNIIGIRIIAKLFIEYIILICTSNELVEPSQVI
jgi:hypothetical protein